MVLSQCRNLKHWNMSSVDEISSVCETIKRKISRWGTGGGGRGTRVPQALVPPPGGGGWGVSRAAGQHWGKTPRHIKDSAKEGISLDRLLQSVRLAGLCMWTASACCVPCRYFPLNVHLIPNIHGLCRFESINPVFFGTSCIFIHNYTVFMHIYAEYTWFWLCILCRLTTKSRLVLWLIGENMAHLWLSVVSVRLKMAI